MYCLQNGLDKSHSAYMNSIPIYSFVLHNISWSQCRPTLPSNTTVRRSTSNAISYCSSQQHNTQKKREKNKHGIFLQVQYNIHIAPLQHNGTRMARYRALRDLLKWKHGHELCKTKMFSLNYLNHLLLICYSY